MLVSIKGGTDVKRRLEIFLALFALGVCSICALSQAAENTLLRKAPELKLRIMLGKETYTLHEKVFTKAEFTNLSDKTLCFPEPVQDCVDSVPGYLITKGEAPANTPGEHEQFICVRDGRAWPGEKLPSEIEQRWIKLAPNKVYVTKSAEANVIFDVPGQWRLETTYHPPEGPFHPAEFRRHIESAARMVGCTIPETAVSAEPITVNVVPRADEK